ncbi:MAG: 50S ribosomal protein L17 [Patescibacteria group bacterium]
MRHAVFGRKLSRTKNERRRLFQGLARDLLVHGAVRTTLAKAKAVQPLVEKLITKAKHGEHIDIVQVQRVLDNRQLTQQLFADAKTRFSGRTSGFTKIVKLGKRLGDAAEEVLFAFIDERVVAEVVQPVTEEKPVKKVLPKRPKSRK